MKVVPKDPPKDFYKTSPAKYAISVVAGPVTGLLPPRMQMKITGGNFKQASVMSTTSRIINGAITICTIAGVLAEGLFGVQIDPTGGNAYLWAGAAISADTALREVLYWGRYGMNSNYHITDEPWGGAIISLVDNAYKKDWYEEYEDKKMPYIAEVKVKRMQKEKLRA